VELNKVVVKFVNGSIQKGKTNDFFPSKKQFHLQLLDGKIVIIDTGHLKAIFFVKDFEGNKEHKDCYEDTVIGGGRKIRVLFPDGETIIGFTQGYSALRQGFFMIPADKDGNNERIYVINSATKDVSFID
jgi:hypothetical protein